MQETCAFQLLSHFVEEQLRACGCLEHSAVFCLVEIWGFSIPWMRGDVSGILYEILEFLYIKTNPLFFWEKEWECWLHLWSPQRSDNQEVPLLTAWISSFSSAQITLVFQERCLAQHSQRLLSSQEGANRYLYNHCCQGRSLAQR